MEQQPMVWSFSLSLLQRGSAHVFAHGEVKKFLGHHSRSMKMLIHHHLVLAQQHIWCLLHFCWHGEEKILWSANKEEKDLRFFFLRKSAINEGIDKKGMFTCGTMSGRMSVRYMEANWWKRCFFHSAHHWSKIELLNMASSMLFTLPRGGPCRFSSLSIIRADVISPLTWIFSE